MSSRNSKQNHGSYQWKYLHPAILIEQLIPNNIHRVQVSDLLTICEQVHRVKRKEQLCLIFCHPSLDNEELHAVKHWVRIDKKEGHPDHYFTPKDLPPVEDANVEPEPPQKVPSHHSCGGNSSAQICALLGFDVDDDDKPAAENLLPPNPDTVKYHQWVGSKQWHRLPQKQQSL